MKGNRRVEVHFGSMVLRILICNQMAVKHLAWDRVEKPLQLLPHFHRPYLLTGIARGANCGYRMIGQPSQGNGHKYLTYTCSGYLRIGKSVCRSVHILTDSLEQEILRSIREHLSSPAWKNVVRETLALMVSEEFGDGAQSRAEDLHRQLEAVNRQIAHIVDAIKSSGDSRKRSIRR